MPMYEDEKKYIIEALESNSPSTAAIAKKNWRRYSKTVQLMLRHSGLDTTNLILDYGAGHGIVAKLLILLGYRVCPFEPYASDIELQSAKSLGIDEIYRTTLDTDELFDCVMLNDVIEHLSVPRITMEHVNRITHKNGCLMVSTPNVLRYNIWLRYVFRSTGHPTSINAFVQSDNNYVHHQREFTLKELLYSLNYYGFEAVYKGIVDTTPSRKDTLGLETPKYIENNTIENVPYRVNPIVRIVQATHWLWPKSLINNNLMVLAKKTRDI